MPTIKEHIANNRFISNILEFAQTVSLPGFDNVSLYNVGLFFIDEIMRDSINIRAASISYNLFLAFFPLTIFLFTLIPYIPIENLEDQLLYFIDELLPEYTYKTIESTIQDIVNIPRKGLTSIGFLLALFFASNGVSSMIGAFEKDNPAFKNEVFYVKKMKAIGITILLTLILLITLILIIGGQLVLNKITSALNIDYRDN